MGGGKNHKIQGQPKGIRNILFFMIHGQLKGKFKGNPIFNTFLNIFHHFRGVTKKAVIRMGSIQRKWLKNAILNASEPLLAVMLIYVAFTLHRLVEMSHSCRMNVT